MLHAAAWRRAAARSTSGLDFAAVQRRCRSIRSMAFPVRIPPDATQLAAHGPRPAASGRPAPHARSFTVATLLLALGAASAAPTGTSPDPKPLIGDPQRGRLLAERYHCGTCHLIPGVPAARGRLAVPLSDFGLRSYIAGRIPNQPELLARWIADPRSLVPDTAMPDMGVTDADARDIAAYLGRLR